MLPAPTKATFTPSFPIFLTARKCFITVSFVQERADGGRHSPFTCDVVARWG
jgi:hypothetical protein